MVALETNMSNNSLSLESCISEGKRVEDMFENALSIRGKFFRRASKEEQFKHIDFFVLNPLNNNCASIDVKSTKKIKRSDNHSNSEYIWVEFKNVQGNDGWLYGSADYVAFYVESANSFFIVMNNDLREKCENLCKEGIAYNSEDALYKHYTRIGRKDDISLIKLIDIKDIVKAVYEC